MQIEYNSLQQNVLIVTPCITSALSIVGSSLILSRILKFREEKLQRVYHRLIFGLSTIDIFVSIGNMMSTLAIPSDTIGSFGAIGNRTSCITQGFILQMGQGIPIYNASLCIYFLMVIKYNISDDKIAKRIEPIMHITAITFPFLTGLWAASIGIFNSTGLSCWIAPNPYGCSETDTCIRGSRVRVFIWAFSGVPLILATIIILGCMSMMVLSVMEQDKKMKSYGFNNSSIFTSRNRLGFSKDAQIQALYFVLAFGTSFIWISITRIYEMLSEPVPFVIVLLSQVFFPLQGLLNFCIYMRPRFKAVKARNNSKSFCWLLMETVKGNEINTRRESMERRRSNIINSLQNTNTAVNEYENLEA